MYPLAAAALPYAKKAQPFVKKVGKYVTKKRKRPIRRFANKAVDWFEKITGFGEYKVSENTLLTDNAPPMFQSSGSGLRVSHREFIGDIKGSINFSLSNFIINPGNVQTFPWLSGLSKNFEQYKFNGLIFEFRSTSGNAVSSTNNALGVVVMATDYDVLDDNYGSKVEMQQSMFCCSGAPSTNLVHPVECDPAQLATKLFYITHVGSSSDADATGRDTRFQNMGNFQIATQGMQADDITIGELWVSYDVTFLKAQNLAFDGEEQVWEFDGVSAVSTFGTDQQLQFNSMLGNPITLTEILPGFGTITFDSSCGGKRYLISYRQRGSSTAAVIPLAVGVYVNVSTSRFIEGTTTILQPTPSGNVDNRYVVFCILVGEGGGSVEIASGGTAPASISDAGLHIVRLNESFQADP